MQVESHIKTVSSHLYSVDNYFPGDYSNILYEKCKKLKLIVEPKMKLGTAHRCMNFYSNESKYYEFSNQKMLSEPIPDFLLQFLNAVNVSLSTKFNGLLVNYYRDGTDSTGSHADNEKGLFNGMVVGYTLMNKGGTRKFRVRDFNGAPVFNGKLFKDLITKHNQLYVMGGDFQKEFKHEVPVEKTNKNAERISITLRYHKE